MQSIKKIYAVKYGETFISEAMAFKGGDRTKKLPISLIVYLIDMQDRRILVDAGCDTMPGFELNHFYRPVEALARAGISAASITDVVITHAHHDHIEALKHFAHATVYLERNEYPEGKRFIPDGCKLVLFDDEMIIADGVRAVKIAGHSRGSCVVECEYKNKCFVICGDECYHKDCIAKGIVTGSSVDEEKSLGFVQRYSDGTRYCTLLCHDADILPGQNGIVEL